MYHYDVRFTVFTAGCYNISINITGFGISGPACSTFDGYAAALAWLSSSFIRHCEHGKAQHQNLLVSPSQLTCHSRDFARASKALAVLAGSHIIARKLVGVLRKTAI